MGKQREDWVKAATRALRAGGLEAVRVEALARELAVTKGSFYWHFENLGALHEALLAAWEAETEWLLAEAEGAPTPAERVLRFFDLAAGSRDYPPDSAIFAWARRDAAVARRAHGVETRRMTFLRRALEEAGMSPAEAGRRAEVGYLATLGWLERSSREPERPDSFRDFLTSVFDLLLHPALGAPAAPRKAAPVPARAGRKG